MTAVAAGIVAGIAGRWAATFLGLGLGAKPLAESVDEKSDDKKEAEPADNSCRKHSRLSLAERAGSAFSHLPIGRIGHDQAGKGAEDRGRPFRCAASAAGNPRGHQLDTLPISSSLSFRMMLS
jgi:hypothetical protein